MLPPTIDEIVNGTGSFTCINYGGALDIDNVDEIRSGPAV